MINKVFFAASLMAMSSVSIADVQDEITKSFKVGDTAEFRLDNINGEVEITGWNKNVIEVTAMITADNQKARDRIEIEMSENGRGVSVETHYKKSNWSKNNSGSVDYTVKLPMTAELASIELINGSLTIEGVSGEMNVELVNGSVQASGLKNDSEISSVNGSIDVSYASASKQLNDINIETVNGRVVLELPENIDADVDVETMHGSIKNDFGLKANKGAFIGKSLEGVLGNGDVRIKIETVNGSVKIKKN